MFLQFFNFIRRINQLAKGVYVLELKNDIKKEVIRFVKE